MKPLASTNSSIILDHSIPATEIGFDFDGVIADTADTFIRLACEEYNFCSYTKADITNFELQNCIDIPQDVVERIFTDILLDSIATGLQPMPGAVGTLSELARHDAVTIITARPVHQPVLDWLQLHFPENMLPNLRVIATGDHTDKLRHINAHGIKYFIDDRAATCIQLAAEEIKPIVFSQPWNHKRHNLQSVASWDEIRALIDLTGTGQ